MVREVDPGFDVAHLRRALDRANSIRNDDFPIEAVEMEAVRGWATEWARSIRVALGENYVIRARMKVVLRTSSWFSRDTIRQWRSLPIGGDRSSDACSANRTSCLRLATFGDWRSHHQRASICPAAVKGTRSLVIAPAQRLKRIARSWPMTIQPGRHRHRSGRRSMTMATRTSDHRYRLGR